MAYITNEELRKRLVAIGFDVPISGNREYLLKFLQKKEKERATSPIRINHPTTGGRESSQSYLPHQDVRERPRAVISPAKVYDELLNRVPPPPPADNCASNCCIGSGFKSCLQAKAPLKIAVAVVILGLAVLGIEGLQRILLCGLKLVAAAAAGYLCWKGFIWNRKIKLREQAEIYELVEKILEKLQKQHETSLKSEGVPPHLAVSHVRDEILTPKERISKAALWDQAVKYISLHESRIGESTQHIGGVDFRTWHWLPLLASPPKIG